MNDELKPLNKIIGQLLNLRVGLYGDAKNGKSRLSCSLPWGHPQFGQKALLLLWDPNEDLSSIMPSDREHLYIERPDRSKDPNAEATRLAATKWVEKYPDINTIIWDGMTVTAKDILKATANDAKFSDKHISMGTKGTPSHVAIPMQGDYGATHWAIQNVLDGLFNQPLNVITIFHAVVDEPQTLETQPVGGPATVGKAAIREIAGRFQNLLRVACSTRLVPGNPPSASTRYNVYTQQKGAWLAGVRSVQELPQEIDITGPEGPVNFWKQFLEARS